MMPRRDGTGPVGSGPAAGWGYGPCGSGYSMGRHSGRGVGFWQAVGKCHAMLGRGMFRQVNRTDVLQEQKGFLEEQLKRIDELLKDGQDTD